MADVRLIVDDDTIDKGDIYEIIDPLSHTVEVHETRELYDSTLSRFSDNQRFVFAILWYEHEVSNGGHQQFLRNSTGIVWADVLKGLDKFGLRDNLDILTTLINLAGGDLSFERATRNRQAEGLTKYFDALDDRFYKVNRDGEIEKSLIKVVRENRADFYFDGVVKNQSEV